MSEPADGGRWYIEHLRGEVIPELKRRIDKCDKSLADQGVLEERMANIGRTLGELRTDMEELRALLIRTAVGIAGSALVFAATIYVVFK